MLNINYRRLSVTELFVVKMAAVLTTFLISVFFYCSVFLRNTWKCTIHDILN